MVSKWRELFANGLINLGNISFGSVIVAFVIPQTGTVLQPLAIVTALLASVVFYLIARLATILYR